MADLDTSRSHDEKPSATIGNQRGNDDLIAALAELVTLATRAGDLATAKDALAEIRALRLAGAGAAVVGMTEPRPSRERPS